MSYLGIFPEVEWLDHIITLLLILGGTTKQFSTAAALCTFPQQCTNSKHFYATPHPVQVHICPAIKSHAPTPVGAGCGLWICSTLCTAGGEGDRMRTGSKGRKEENFSPKDARAALLILSHGPLPWHSRSLSGTLWGKAEAGESGRADVSRHISEDRRGAGASQGRRTKD